MMQSHPAYPKLLELSKSSDKSTFELLAERLETLQAEKAAKTLSM